jgi:hypothetical protein
MVDSLTILYLAHPCTIQSSVTQITGKAIFFKTDQFIGEIPPTIQELKKQLKNKDARYINMLRHFSRNIKGGGITSGEAKPKILKTGSHIMLHRAMAHQHFSSPCLAQKTGGQM